MYIETSKNEYGTPIDCYICETCGDNFSICPANEDRSRDHAWTGCLATTCASYDPDRDCDKLFDDDNVLSFDQRANPNRITRRPVRPS
jgi:hypothetical protein